VKSMVKTIHKGAAMAESYAQRLLVSEVMVRAMMVLILTLMPWQKKKARDCVWTKHMSVFLLCRTGTIMKCEYHRFLCR
jgi:hypothetical protein